jgi:hypothetical protein
MKTPNQTTQQPLARRDKLLLDLRLNGPNRRFQFRKSSQLFIRTHNEALTVAAMRVSNEDCAPVAVYAETQPQLQSDLLRLSAVISQYLTRRDSASFALYTAMTK